MSTITPGGWAALVPELICTDLPSSRSFYCELIGFSPSFEREEGGFAYLALGHAQIMLKQRQADSWTTAPLDPPLGRGVNFQIEVPSIALIDERLRTAGIVLYRAPAERWYRAGSIEHGQSEMLVQDPDGYLLRLIEIIGTRPARAQETTL